jgi:hypothetical protein
MLMRSPLARARRQPPGFIRPCRPVLSLKVPAGPQWIHELKKDGFRIVAHKDGDIVRLWGRNGEKTEADDAGAKHQQPSRPYSRMPERRRATGWRTHDDQARRPMKAPLGEGQEPAAAVFVRQGRNRGTLWRRGRGTAQCHLNG